MKVLGMGSITLVSIQMITQCRLLECLFLFSLLTSLVAVSNTVCKFTLVFAEHSIYVVAPIDFLILSGSPVFMGS